MYYTPVSFCTPADLAAVQEHGITADGDCHERNPTPSSGSLAPASRQPTGIGSGRSDSSGNTVKPNPYASLASQKPVSGDALSPVLGVRSMVMSGRGGGNGSSKEHAARAAEARKAKASGAVGSAAAGQGGANSTTASKTAGSGGERAVGTKRGRQFVERCVGVGGGGGEGIDAVVDDQH